jgi:hypothetical protein
MKLISSDSAEVSDSIASTRVRACWGWSLPTFVWIGSLPGLVIALIASLIVSVRTGIWLGVPTVLGLNGYLLWRGRSAHLNWVTAACADRVFVRLFMQRGRGLADMQEPNVLVLRASEIASIRVRVVEVFLYGPKPSIVEWLVIEAAQVVTQDISFHISPLLKADDPGQRVYVRNGKGCITIDWQPCRPALRLFLHQVARECPSIVMAPEERSELDLNGIWKGNREMPNADQRRMLVQAKRLGFGCKCAELLRLHRCMSVPESNAYLAEIEREEAVTEDSCWFFECRF